MESDVSDVSDGIYDDEWVMGMMLMHVCEGASCGTQKEAEKESTSYQARG